MMIIGICAGLLAATFQSTSYLFSRGFVLKKFGAPVKLIFVSQVFMALMSLPVFIFTYGSDVPELTQYFLPLFLATAFYTIGQAVLFMIIRNVQASRIAPMLGFKIVMLAFISLLFLGVTPTRTQWLGVAIATCGVVILNFSGGRLSIGTSLGIFLACLAYSLSDIFITILIDSLAPLSLLRASFYATAVSYMLCGSFSLIVLIIRGEVRDITRGIRFSLPYAICWLSGMFALFTCFGAIGPILGNILQSSRGVISILIAIPAVRLGFPLLEPSSPRRVVLQRLTSATLIIAAVWLYTSG